MPEEVSVPKIISLFPPSLDCPVQRTTFTIHYSTPWEKCCQTTGEKIFQKDLEHGEISQWNDSLESITWRQSIALLFWAFFFCCPSFCRIRTKSKIYIRPPHYIQHPLEDIFLHVMALSNRETSDFYCCFRMKEGHRPCIPPPLQFYFQFRQWNAS